MMTNEEIIKEVKSNLNLEGISVNVEQENRMKKLLSGEASFNEIKEELNNKYLKEACNE